jgi:hypothetical protein
VSFLTGERSYCETKQGALRASSLYFVIDRGIHSRMLGSSDTQGFWRLDARGLLISSARLGYFS